MTPAHGRARLLPSILGVVACIVAGACQAAADTRPRPPSVPVVRVAMRDYRFEHDPVVPRGRVVVRADNAGRVDHALTLVRLPEDLPLSAGDLVHDETRRTFALTARLFRRAPGSGGTFAVDLYPGRYALFCNLPDSDGQSHVEKGMVSQFEVR